MTAIDKNLLENLRLFEEAKRLNDAGFINADQIAEAKRRLDLPKTNANLLVRIGFFLLGSFLYSSLTGFLSLILLDFGSHYKIMLFIYAFIGIGVCEFLASKNYYAFGLDDAFIAGSQTVLCAAIGVAFESVTVYFAAMGIFGFFYCVRYANTISALFGVIGVSGFFASLFINELSSTALLPFVMLFVALALYFTGWKLSAAQNSRLTENSVGTIKATSLVLGYLSMNYLVVRELSERLMDAVVAPGQDISFAFFFYALTFLIPPFYLVCSIKFKDRMFFIIGLLAVAFSVFTIRFYYSVMPLEGALFIGGAALFAATYFFIRKIRHNDVGITYKPDRYTQSEALSYAQIVIANSHSHIRRGEANQSPMDFGGGGFSGGGAGENF